MYNVGHQGGQFIFYKKGVAVSATEAIKERKGKTRSTDEEDHISPIIPKPPITKPTETIRYTSLNDLKDQCKKEIISLKKVFELLTRILKSNSQDSLIMLQARYKQIEKQQRLGIASFDQVNITTNQIRVATLSLIDDLEEEDIKDHLLPAKSKEIEKLEREGMSNMEKLMVRKINFLEEKLLLETDASVQFKLQYEIDELKEKLEKLRGA